MSETPTREPDKITAGDYVQWKKLGADCLTPAGDSCLASAGWQLTYALVKSGQQITISASASGDDHLVTLAASATANYSPGIYSWQAYVTGGSSERYMVDSGTIEILPNLATAATGYDDRSHVKKVLDALEARLEKRATADQAQTLIGGEVIAYMPIQRVLEWRDKYKAYYAQEIQAEAIANGLGGKQNIKVRFSNA